jgi:hypothetical protein
MHGWRRALVAAVVSSFAVAALPLGAGALTPGDADLSGTVDSGGRPTDSVFVQLCQGADCETSAINAGSYGFTGVAPGAYELRVAASSSVDFYSTVLGPVVLVSGANARDVTLPLGGRISGTVTDPGGSGRAGAVVSACVAAGACATAFSGSDGTFETTAVAPGPVTVVASPGGFEPVPTVYPSVVAPAVVVAGTATPVGSLRLRAAGSLSGTVRDANGNAVDGAVVQLSGSTALSVTSAQTVTGGAYSFPSLEPGLRSVAVGAGPGSPLSPAGQVTIAEGVASVLDLTLPAAARITGVYSRADGLPLAGGIDDGVILCPGATDASVFTPPLGFCPGFSVVPSTAGAFDLTGRPAGTYSLAALGGGFAAGYPLRSQSVTVTVGAGETAACSFLLAPLATPGAAGCAVAPPDDADGVPAAVEDAGPNGGDGNLDGILDSAQPEVSSLPAAVGGGYVTVAVPAGLTLQGVAAVDPATLGTPLPPGATVPFGLVDFTVSGVAPGGSVTVQVYRSAAGATPNAWLKFVGGAWVDATSLAADVAANPVVLTLTDDAFGDDDPAPGVIRDPSGPALVDRTAPTVTCGATPRFTVGQTPALVTGTVTDTGSGPTSPTVSTPADTSTVGSRTVTLEGTDLAGNSATVACPYVVERPSPLAKLVTLLRWLLDLFRR